MIENITLKYTSKHIPNDYKYVARDNDDKKRQLLPKEVKFTDGLNLVIGENGCGKSTLLKLITDMCFVHGLSTQGNFWDIINRVFPKSDWLNHDYSVVQDFVQISTNFDSPIIRIDQLSERMNRNYGELTSFNDFAQYIGQRTMSKGEKMMYGLKWAVYNANEKIKDYSWENMFPKNYHKCFNDTWSTAYCKIHDYIETHNNPKLEQRVTLLMDEPDEGLDINNLKILKDFLLSIKDKVQVIVILHNQLLIKSLAEEANVIELSENYLQKIKEF